MTKRHSKEVETTRTVKVIGSTLDAKTQIILSENDRNHRRTRTKGILSEVRGVIEVRKMMKRLKMKRVSWLKHLARKQAHASHKAKNIVSTTRCLELLHMDLFGPSTVRSYGGNLYTLVIAGDYSRGKKETKAMVFHKLDTEEVSDKFMAPCFVNGLEAYDGEINIGMEEKMISNEFALKLCLENEVKRGNKVVKKKLIVALRGEIYFVKFIINPEEDDVEPEPKVCLVKEVKPVLETMDYHDKYKKVLDEIWKDKLELNRMIEKEDEEAIKKVKGKALKEKPILKHSYFLSNWKETLGREEIKKVDKGITKISHTQTEAMRMLTNVLCQVVNTPERLFSTFDGFCHKTFCAARSNVIRTAESDSDDEEEYLIKRNKFGAPIYGPKPASYLNCNDPAKRSLALQAVINLFWKISVLKKAEVCRTSKKSLRPKRSTQYKTAEEVLLPQVHHEFLLSEGCNGEAKSRLHEVGSNEEIFTSVAWIGAFNINEQFMQSFATSFIRSMNLMKSLSAPIYCIDLDATTLRELIDSEGSLIPDDPQPGVHRVGIPRPLRASI
nr:retrovirus-related Pol polyprotein from transposon TNT 1-94 [Tanacetum cinerariifolium]